MLPSRSKTSELKAAAPCAGIFLLALVPRLLHLDKTFDLDEMATAALSVMLRRPVKFVADRLESFLTDIHAREHKATVRLACTRDGRILAFDLDDLTAIGPYSVYPRTSGIEGNQVVNLTGGPYQHREYRAKMKPFYYDALKYDTYLEQLGIKYPTVRPRGAAK